MFARTASPEAFRRLVEQHLPAVHSAARRVLGANGNQAEDVAQLVFLRLAKKGRSLPESIVLGAWLHRQTVRLALNVLRSEARRLAREQRAAEMQSMERSPTSPDPAWQDLVPHIDRAILKLPEKDRVAIALRFGERRRMREVAERLCVSTAAAEKRVGRALEKLRGILIRRGVALSGIAVVGAMLSQHCVQAAPASLAGSILEGSAAAIESAAAPGIISTITAMTFVKSLGAGALAGLMLAGALAVWASAHPDDSASASSVPQGERTKSARLNALARPSGSGAWSVPKPGPSAEVVFGQLRDLLDEPDNERTRLKMRGLLLQLAPGQFPSLLKLVEGEITKDSELRRVLPEFAKAWATVDPTEAIGGMASSKGGYFQRETLAMMAFQQWHSSWPLAAQDWLVVNQEEQIYAKAIPLMITVVAKSLAEDSDDRVIRWAVGLVGNDYRGAALKALWDPFIRDSSNDHSADLRRLVESFKEVGDEAFLRGAVRSMSTAWAHWRTDELVASLKTMDPGPVSFESALAMVRETHRYSHKAWPAINDEMHMRVRRLALALADPDRPQSEVVAEIVMQSVAVPRDLAGWAIPLMEEGAARDAAIRRAANRVSHTGKFDPRYPPPLLALEWVRHHSDPVERERLTAHYLQKFTDNPHHSPAEIREHLREGDWSAEIYALVRE